MLSVIRFCVLFAIKLLTRSVFQFSVQWVGTEPKTIPSDVRLLVFLNHTSLLEPVFLGVVPIPLVWKIARRGIFPGADITLGRPITGTLYKLMAPDVVTITRKRDSSWENFLLRIQKDSLIIIAPEGRMKRPSGLDKEGKPMTVRGGIADLLRLLDQGKMIIAYSGGLHHIHVPGQRFPRLFKRLSIRFELIDIRDYKQSLGPQDNHEQFKTAVICDLEARRDKLCADPINAVPQC